MPDHQELLSFLHRGSGPEPESFEAWLAQQGERAWDRLIDCVHRRPQLIDDDALRLLAGRCAENPGGQAWLLILLATCDPERRERLASRCLAHLEDHPGPSLNVAGHQLHEHHRLIDARWIAAARKHIASDAQGAWGVFEAAAMYEPEAFAMEDVAWLDAQRTSAPASHAVVMLSLAQHWPSRREELLGLALRGIEEHPAEAMPGVVRGAGGEADLLTPELIAAVLRLLSLARDPASRTAAWELMANASKAVPERFADPVLDTLDVAAAEEPGTLFLVLQQLIAAQPARLPALRERFAGLMRCHPQAGIDAAFYCFQGELMAQIDAAVVAALLAGFQSSAYHAYQFLGWMLERRGELVDDAVVDAAVANIAHATNYAFGFFRALIVARPEFTAQGALALFECLAREPINRAHVRVEQLEALSAIAEASHVRTGLESALRAPPRHGSRRARALLSILFRDKRRARRHVLMEALRWAATTVLRRAQADAEGENRHTPVWDFTLFIVDHSGDDAHSTAAAERFLEGAFQLSHLFQSGAEAETFLERLDPLHAPHVPLPAGVAGLVDGARLTALHDLVIDFGRRFGIVPHLALFGEFAGRAAVAKAEIAALEQRLADTATPKQAMLEKRIQALRQRVRIWESSAYQRAVAGGDDAELDVSARDLLRQERKDLTKRVHDALRAEAVRIAVEAVERTRLSCYRERVREIIGSDIDLSTIEPSILPAFLWFPAIAHMPNNTRWLRCLVEDRLLGRPHSWLRDEPAAREWAERVRAAQPQAQLERWRATFSREYTYRPQDAQAEKRRRIVADLAQARALLERAGGSGFADGGYDELARVHAELSAPPSPPDQEKQDEPRPRPDAALLAEVAMNLERVRLAEQTPDSDFSGRITLRVETDPIQMLFMGEYGFASCLSLRGINAWGAVSNAIDIDKAIVWACEPGGNVVGRRLLALVPEGVLTFGTYTNRHGLALNDMFTRFIAEYAGHCGVPLAHGVRSGPLLSDRWYDDGAL